MSQEKHFIYTEASNNPLKRCDNKDILEKIIDPTTGKQYDGIILEGEFASIGELNNNNRIYTEDNYLVFVEQLKLQVFSAKGLYGHLEHPKGYSTDVNLISHKILDIWYDKSLKKVFGIIMLLNTVNGKNAQEIIKSGGQLAVSARGGGSEIANPDGTINAVLKLMITFDIVYHPGFSSSIVSFTKLNENNNNIQYNDEIGKLINFYESQKINIQLFESERTQKNKAEKAEIKHDAEIMQKGELAKEDKVENELSNSVKKELKQEQLKLNESFKLDFHNQMNKAVGKYSKLNNAVYDNSAGFVTEGISTSGMD